MPLTKSNLMFVELPPWYQAFWRRQKTWNLWGDCVQSKENHWEHDGKHRSCWGCGRLWQGGEAGGPLKDVVQHMDISGWVGGEGKGTTMVEPRQGTSHRLLFSAHKRYTNPIFLLSHGIPLCSKTACTTIRNYCSNPHMYCQNADLRLGYVPKFKKCETEQGERITIPDASSPSKDSWSSMSESRDCKSLYGWISTH